MRCMSMTSKYDTPESHAAHNEKAFEPNPSGTLLLYCIGSNKGGLRGCEAHRTCQEIPLISARVDPVINIWLLLRLKYWKPHPTPLWKLQTVFHFSFKPKSQRAQFIHCARRS